MPHPRLIVGEAGPHLRIPRLRGRVVDVKVQPKDPLGNLTAGCALGYLRGALGHPLAIIHAGHESRSSFLLPNPGDE